MVQLYLGFMKLRKNGNINQFFKLQLDKNYHDTHTPKKFTRKSHQKLFSKKM